MRIAAFSVRNYQFTIVLFVLLGALGVNAWFTIPRGEDPAFPIPIFAAVAVYPGATPTDIEQLVVDPIEEKLNALDDVKSIKTTVESGLAIIRIEFDATADADKKYDDVLREINTVRPTLPAELASLEVQKFNTSEVNIIQVGLVGPTTPYATLDSLAGKLKDRLKTVPGVKDAETWGFPQREVTVEVNLGRLAALRLPVAQVLGALQGESANIPGGSVDLGSRRFNVKTSGNYERLDQVRNTVVRSGEGSTVRLRDLADVRWGYDDSTYYARMNGQRAVFVTVKQKIGQNIQLVRDRVWSTLDEFERGLPGGVTLARGFDQSKNVTQRLGRLQEDFAIAILLVLVTLLPLGFRASLIVMIAIPLSLAIGLTLLALSGYSINQLSIVGFVIALGLLVDDSIVVVENITRFLREGHSRTEAAILATRQIGVAVLGCTATLLFAFLPLLFLPGTAGQYIRSLPMAVVYTILASLLVSLTIVPFLASRLLPRGEGAHGNVFLRLLDRAINASYARVLHLALGRPRTTIAAAGALFLGSLALVPVVGFSLFPKAGTPQFMVTVEMPQGTALDATDRAVRYVEGELRKWSSVRTIMANTGRGNPSIYYNVTAKEQSSSWGDLFVLLDRYDPRRTPASLDSLQQIFDAVPGARIEVREFENGPVVDAPIAIRLLAENLDTLDALAGRVQTVLEQVPGTRNVINPLQQRRTDLRLALDPSKAGLLNVPTLEIDRTVRLALAGLPAGSLREATGDDRPITVRLPREGRPTLQALDAIYVANTTGGQVPLRQVADVRFESSPTVIQHYGTERSVTVTARVRTGYNTASLTSDVMRRLSGMPFPPGTRWIPAGEYESRQESFGGIGGAILVAVFGILAILVLEFGSFKSTLIVASVIPLGIVGGIVALLVGGNTLSFTAAIGFVALVGIEIKNSILLVDFTNQLRQEGAGLDEAIEEAGRIRFLPIVLTTLTAIGGLLPLALQGSSLYSPLAQVIIGGLISSTILARLVTPVMYKVLAPAVTVTAAA